MKKFRFWLTPATRPARPVRRRLGVQLLEDRTVPAASGLVDPGFEAPALTAGQFRYLPTGSAWTFGGNAGISANGSGFTAGNPGAPEGRQVAFLQQSSTMSQSATFAAGAYAVTFNAAQRGNVPGTQTLQVLVDGAVVGSFNTVSGTGYTSLTSTTFNLSAGTHTITFKGTNLYGVDATMLIDNVGVTPVVAGIVDTGFERPALALGAFQYNPTGGSWSYSGTAGIATNYSPFTGANPPTPQGNQVLFLQGNGAATQSGVFAAGTYTIGFAFAQRANGGGQQTINVLVDGKVVGTFNNFGNQTYAAVNTSSFTLSAGSHTVSFQGTNLVGGDNTAFIDQVTVMQQAAGLADSAFELPAIAAGTFRYNPSGGPWAFTGTSGVATNYSAFTSGNPIAPQGNQVLFLQGTGAVSQVVNFPAGSYAIQFSAAQRGNGGGKQTFNILLDGQVLGVVNNLSGTGYSALTTTTFTATAGNHTITLVGTNLNGGDNTAFVDQLAVVRSAAGFADSAFELVSLPAGSFRYNPTGSGWTFAGTSGLAANNSGFTAGNAAAPDGSQVAFLQRNGSISQVTNFAAGTYTINFLAAQRALYSTHQTFQVLVDGKVVGSYNSVTGPGYSEYASSSFNVAAGNHTVTFQGTNLAGGDNTAFIDQITIVQQPAGLGDSGFEQSALAYGTFLYAPTTSPWVFTGTAGVSTDNSAFTSRNQVAPQGGQVAFLQQFGSFSQVVNFTAGIYDISFFAAQRANAGSTQTFRVLVDGVVVGIYNGLTETTYVSFVTDEFSVSAGNHTITFQGTNLAGGDNTVFLDQITITALS
ncbi:MAG: hypothetical protein K1X57_03645 [Gemmataceae bacterium]|nr:hypothetical protein [Gemmataceae bacterium]